MTKNHTTSIEQLNNWLDGKKSYVAAALLFFVSGAEGIGWINHELASTLKGLIVAFGMASLRAAIAKGTNND